MTEDREILLSFCIPTYRRKDIVIECIKEIQKILDERIEILVCDNHSEDGTKEAVLGLKKSDSRITYAENEENIGFSKNLVKSQKIAKGKYVFVLSDEDKVDIRFMSKILKNGILNNELYDIITGSLYFPKKDIYMPKYLKESKNNSYLKNLYDVISPWYICGFILKKEKINFNSLYLKDERNLYPQVMMRIGMGKNIKVKIFNEIICHAGEIERTEHQQVLDNKKSTTYYLCDARIAQIKFWNEYLKNEIEDEEYRQSLYKVFARIYAGMYRNEYINKNKMFYDEIIKIKEMKSYFIFYNYIVLGKNILKKILPNQIIKVLKKIRGY